MFSQIRLFGLVDKKRKDACVQHYYPELNIRALRPLSVRWHKVFMMEQAPAFDFRAKVLGLCCGW